MTTNAPIELSGIAESPVRALAQDRMKQVRAQIFLAGSLRPTRFTAAIDRSRMDMPVNEHQTILQRWLEELELLHNSDHAFQADIRVMLDAHSPAPRSHEEMKTPLNLTVERDPRPYRGTAGLLRDITRDYNDDDLILVANGGHVLIEPAMSLVPALVGREADVVLTADPDGTPADVMLIRCGVLRDVKSLGFVDFKEQALPAIARRHKVVVERRYSAVGLPVRTMSDYIQMLRTMNRAVLGPVETRNAFDEEWQAHFKLCDPGAHVSDDARVHDSVILDGARVERGAVVSRSVVCPGGVVEAGRIVVDELVCDEARVSERIVG